MTAVIYFTRGTTTLDHSSIHAVICGKSRGLNSRISILCAATWLCSKVSCQKLRQARLYSQATHWNCFSRPCHTHANTLDLAEIMQDNAMWCFDIYSFCLTVWCAWCAGMCPECLWMWDLGWLCSPSLLPLFSLPLSVLLAHLHRVIPASQLFSSHPALI